VFSAARNEPTTLSKIAGEGHPGVGRGSNTKARFAAGWSEFLLTRLWTFCARRHEALKAEWIFEEIPSEHETGCTAEIKYRRRFLKMFTQRSTKRTEGRNHHEQRLTPDGTLVEFLSAPDETGTDICLIRGTIPPGVAVPLHSHPDVELFYVLEGSMECFEARDGTARWTTLGAGDAVTIPGNIKHAWRNRSPLPATAVIVTTSKMYQFFHEVTRPFDPAHPPTPPTPDEIQVLLRAAGRYGYWMGSPQENQAIGLSLG